MLVTVSSADLFFVYPIYNSALPLIIEVCNGKLLSGITKPPEKAVNKGVLNFQSGLLNSSDWSKDWFCSFHWIGQRLNTESVFIGLLSQFCFCFFDKQIPLNVVISI